MNSQTWFDVDAVFIFLTNIFSVFFFCFFLDLFSPNSLPEHVAVDPSLLQWSLDCGTIPVVCPVGRDDQGCSVLLNPTEVTAAIARVLQPHKVMFLNNSGALRSQEHKARRATSCGICFVRQNLFYL